MFANLWWIFQKDLITEFRARRVWPAMLLLGVVVALVFGIQMELLPEQKQQLVGGLLWLAIFFAGMTAIDRSFVAEREQRCWDGLKLYPVQPWVIYLAKFGVNSVALAAVQCVLVPLFFVLADISLMSHPWHLLLAAVLGNAGIAAVGTLVSALAAGMGRSGRLVVVLVLPLVVPVLLAAAEATRLLADGNPGEAWWRWIQLLGVFAVIFVTAGTLLFEFAMED